MIEVITDIEEMRRLSRRKRSEGARVGLVPTMGFLHEGHLSLIRMAKRECDKVFISIFINPTQFGPGEDFESYPRDTERDRMLAEREGVDYIFYPKAREMYKRDSKTFVEVQKLSKIMCGKSRTNHFKGVATVVLKLFNIINAHKAYFGEKDFQQLIIIRKMVEDLNLDIEVIGSPTIREKDGLALSSRNKYLSEEERKSANILYKCLNLAKNMIENGERDLEEIRKVVLDKLKENKFVKNIDYFEFRDPRTLEKRKRVGKEHKKIMAATAVWIGRTRLIDNIIIKVEK